MSNFRQKLKKILESSFNENKKIDSIYHKKHIQNNDLLDSKFRFNKVSKLYIPERIRTKNNSFLNNINNYNNKESEKISLYKKFKKYNSILERPKIKVCRNILDSYKINENSKTRKIFENSLTSQMLSKNKRPSNSLSTNHLTIDNILKNPSNKKNNNRHKINYRNNNFLEYEMSKIRRKKNSINPVGNKIIQKIQSIENENKEKKVKNLLINRSPIVFNNSIYKSSNYSYTYYLSKSRNDSKNKQNNYKKNKNFLDLNDLKDIISSIKNQKYTIIKGKEFNNLNK